MPATASSAGGDRHSNIPETLGILVHSNNCFDHVLTLAQAAVAKGKQVRICLLGPGTAIIHTDLSKHLSDGVRLFVCGAGPATFRWRTPAAQPIRMEVMPAHRFMEILQTCDRHVAF